MNSRSLRRYRARSRREAALARFRAEIAASRPVTTATVLAGQYGVYVASARGRCGTPALVAIGDGWRIWGTPEQVEAELGRRAAASEGS